MQTQHDAFLWYNVGDWAKYGLAVPNWSDDFQGQNDTIVYLTSIIGRNLQNLMFHHDANLRTPPSINTVRRIHMLCTRARSILSSRAVPPAELNMEPAHAVPSPEVFRVYPTPYFNVRNPWMRQYAGFALLALTEAMQHSENAKPIEISEQFAALIGQYFHRVYRLMAVELLRVADPEATKDPTFTITEQMLAAYKPADWFTSTEMLDTVPPLEDKPTEDTLRILTDGIPITRLPVLGRWPSGPGVDNPSTGEATAAPKESFSTYTGV